jgi:hypothetical protein
MGWKNVLTEGMEALLDVCLVTATSIAADTLDVLVSIRGDIDPDGGNEEVPDSELYGHAPLMYRPPDPDDAGRCEGILWRWGDERIVIATKDRRWQVEPAAGEVILAALGKDGTEQARVSLAADGTITITGDTVVVAADNVYLGDGGATKHVAYREDVEGAFSTLRSEFLTHVHTAVTVGSGSSGAPASPLSDPGTLGSGNVLSE